MKEEVQMADKYIRKFKVMDHLQKCKLKQHRGTVFRKNDYG